MPFLIFYSGFSGLIPNFCIRDAGGDENRLPTSSTCMNLLKVLSYLLCSRMLEIISPLQRAQLPRYKSERVLRQKLLQALYSGAGFDLS
jgi:ubiquitin-protein ligase E3 C